jgi:hypothetical protein
VVTPHVAASAQAVDFDLDLFGFDEVVRYVPAAGAHQHRAAHDNAARNR